MRSFPRGAAVQAEVIGAAGKIHGGVGVLLAQGHGLQRGWDGRSCSFLLLIPVPGLPGMAGHQASMKYSSIRRVALRRYSGMAWGLMTSCTRHPGIASLQVCSSLTFFPDEQAPPPAGAGHPGAGGTGGGAESDHHAVADVGGGGKRQLGDGVRAAHTDFAEENVGELLGGMMTLVMISSSRIAVTLVA